MADSSASGLDVTIDGPVARFTLRRPEKLNALNDDVRRTLAAALDELEERPEVRVIVLSGDGRAFSAGADLRRTAYPPVEGDWVTRRHRTGTWQRVLEQLDRVPQATVARLHGHVIGGAALLAAACDLRVAADDTVVRIPELAIGIPLTWAGIPLLVREVGLPLTRDWVMTCRPVAAQELLRSGFAQRVVPRDELDAAVDRCVDELLAVPPGPLAMTRAMTSAISRAHPAMVAGWGDADHQQWSFTEDEYRAAVRAYVAGR
ncbi:MAG TPA: enoyl-CoA hydratase/isomerase family protein [Acidimicrobiales bacterium]|jgi:enoyl-CoA hydratase/carnithine racemase|nr:enoyl-CoA hydratase/isomerase family protein [Acidimicrobiales bacterium]